MKNMKIDNKKIGLVIVLLGAFVLLFGAVWAATSNTFKHPIEECSYGESTIYGRQTLLWEKIEWGSNLKAGALNVRQTNPYSLAIKELALLGSGQLSCTADLINSKGQSVFSDAQNLEEFGGVFQSTTQYYAFTLKGCKGMQYTISVNCVDQKNTENNIQTSQMVSVI